MGWGLRLHPAESLFSPQNVGEEICSFTSFTCYWRTLECVEGLAGRVCHPQWLQRVVKESPLMATKQKVGLCRRDTTVSARVGVHPLDYVLLVSYPWQNKWDRRGLILVYLLVDV